MGFIVLLPALLILMVGTMITAAITARAQAQKGKASYTVISLLIGLTSTTAMTFSFVVLSFGGLANDADTGALDTFKTPLGGGYYLLSIDLDRELPLPLMHRKGEQSTIFGPQPSVSGLACLGNRTYLRFKEGFGWIDVSERRLKPLRSNELPVLASESNFWLDKTGFLRTPCANVKASLADKIQNVLAMLFGPLCALLGLIWLRLWGQRIPDSQCEISASSG